MATTNLSLRKKHNMSPNSLKNLKPWTGDKPPYATWLASLSPEEYEKHMAERKERMRDKTMKQAMVETINQHGDKWSIMLEAAVHSVMTKAIEQGDPAALNSVWDRVVGRPDTVMDVKVKQEDEVNDVLAKLQSTVLIEEQTKQDKE
jgi:hypothetical protein